METFLIIWFTIGFLVSIAARCQEGPMKVMGWFSLWLLGPVILAIMLFVMITEIEL